MVGSSSQARRVNLMAGWGDGTARPWGAPLDEAAQGSEPPPSPPPSPPPGSSEDGSARRGKVEDGQDGVQWGTGFRVSLDVLQRVPARLMAPKGVKNRTLGFDEHGRRACTALGPEGLRREGKRKMGTGQAKSSGRCFPWVSPLKRSAMGGR